MRKRRGNESEKEKDFHLSKSVFSKKGNWGFQLGAVIEMTPSVTPESSLQSKLSNSKHIQSNSVSWSDLQPVQLEPFHNPNNITRRWTRAKSDDRFSDIRVLSLPKSALTDVYVLF